MIGKQDFMEYNLKTADFADYADFKNAQAH